jgi:hypothetical protein
MSTKIYDAYYVPHGMEGVLAVKKILEHKYEEYVLQELDRFKDKIGKDLIYKNSHLMGWEKWVLKQINPYRDPKVTEWERPLNEMGNLETEYVIRANSRCMERGVPLALDCSMVVFYYRKKFYAQFFGFDYWWAGTFKELRKTRKIKDWHYQNQTDKPDNVSDKAWEERENVWEGIFKEQESDTPAQCGFTVNFIDRIQRIIMRWHNLIYRGSLDTW